MYSSLMLTHLRSESHRKSLAFVPHTAVTFRDLHNDLHHMHSKCNNLQEAVTAGAHWWPLESLCQLAW